MRPMRDAVGRPGQHADRYSILARHASRPQAERKRAKVKRQTANEKMRQLALQVTAVDLGNFRSSSLNDVLEFLKMVDDVSLN